jgi:NAD(P)-dependent dehydrogenase (short-subunit alcohol dehydrogenase family)
MGEGLEQLASPAPAGRPATADEIAEAVLFLATDRASFSTVQNSLSTEDALPIEACELAM